MPRTKISEFSVTPGDNTDIDGINIAEGCAPSGINDAIRELMAQLKDFQSGAAGDNITVVGTLAAKGTSSSGADLKLYEDTDNGTNYVGFIAPASIASNVQWTLPSADGSSGQALQTNGSGTLSFATLGISAGGTGQTTANAAFNALAPSQTSNAGRYLKTDGTNTSWDLLDISTADITGTLPVANGGTGITSFGTGVATALGINVGSSGAFVTNGGALGTPSSGTVTNLTGTASININGTVGATTPNTGSFTTLTTSSTVTINGGTANGVAYLNGSKVLTTGSALTFDGTRLLTIGNGTFAQTTLNASAVLQLEATNGSSVRTTQTQLATGGLVWNNDVGGNGGSPLYAWQIVGSEQMRLTSTGLGIGTSSPLSRLHVEGSTTGAIQLFIKNGNGSTNSSSELVFGTWSGSIPTGSGNPGPQAKIAAVSVSSLTAATDLTFWTYSSSASSAERMRLDSSGNLGLGVTPSAWGTGFQSVIETKNIGVLAAAGPYVSVMANAYYNSSNQYIYKTSAQATHYAQALGQHQWFTAGSGTAGNAISFTQAMTLDASGNLLVGYTTAYDKLQVNGSISSQGGGYFGFYRNGPSNNIATLDGVTISQFGISSGVSTGRSDASTWIAGFDSLRLVTAGTERARITSGGDLLVGTTSALSSVSGSSQVKIGEAGIQTTSQAISANTATTIARSGSGGVAIVAGYNGTGQYSAIVLFKYGGTATSVVGVLNDTGSTITYSISGVNLQITSSLALTNVTVTCIRSA